MEWKKRDGVCKVFQNFFFPPSSRATSGRFFSVSSCGTRCVLVRTAKASQPEMAWSDSFVLLGQKSSLQRRSRERPDCFSFFFQASRGGSSKFERSPHFRFAKKTANRPRGDEDYVVVVVVLVVTYYRLAVAIVDFNYKTTVETRAALLSAIAVEGEKYTC